MELLDGMDLETLVDKFGAQPAARVIHFLIQACNSLAEAHDAGLVHRDIKPANLYVCRVADEVDVIKVLDFGLVRAALRRATSRGQSAPSASARSNAATTSAQTKRDVRRRWDKPWAHPPSWRPEQALGHESDGRADLYALGCVGFCQLTGRLLFERSTLPATMMAHITEPPPQIAARRWPAIVPPGSSLLSSDFASPSSPLIAQRRARTRPGAQSDPDSARRAMDRSARPSLVADKRTARRRPAPARQDELGIA